jgi:bifunctional non-homologous end joining protein LigD
VVKTQGLEGLVAKRCDSRYEPGQRSGAWAKMRVNQAQELVIGGYKVGGRTFDAVVFGYYDGQRLIYVARTRNGFSPSSREALSGSSRDWRSRNVRSRICPRPTAAAGINDAGRRR